MQELEIIEKAIINLQQTTGIRANYVQTEGAIPTDDFLDIRYDNHRLHFDLQVKKQWNNQHLQQLTSLTNNNHYRMVAGPHFAPKFKAALREMGIAYLEANGNFFLKTKDLFIWIDSNKPLVQEEKATGRAFTKTGLRLVFQLLLEERLIDQPYRNLKELTGIGIGNITNIYRDLKQEGYLLKMNNDHYRLHQKKGLLEKWVDAYEKRLKPTIKIGRFRLLDQQNKTDWRNIPLDEHKTCWGAEPAGALLTNYLQPAVWTLYTTENRNELMRKYRFIPDENGTIEVYKKFWPPTEVRDTAPPLLVYADLINTGDKRCIETAQLVYNEYLQQQFQ